MATNHSQVVISFLGNLSKKRKCELETRRQKKQRLESQVPSLESLAQAVLLSYDISGGSHDVKKIPLGFWKAVPFFHSNASLFQSKQNQNDNTFYLYALG